MKKQVLSIAVRASLLLALTVVTAYAVTSSRVVITIPFGFNAGDASIPAGIYTISETRTSHILLIRNQQGAGAFLSTLSLDASQVPSKPKLVFHRYGTEYFLAQVSFGGHEAYTMTKSRAEREFLKGKSNSRAMGELKPDLIYINAE
jgi:hypothetical protein